MPDTDSVSSSWLTVALEEYKALRAEIVDAIQAHRTIMQLGVTGVSVLIGLGLQHVPSLLAAAILSILTPAITVFITAAAWGEFFRAARASSFLSMRERTINETFSELPPAMTWESWLRRQRIFAGNTKAQFLVLYFLTIEAAIIGVVTMFTSKVWRGQPLLLTISVGVASTEICTWSLIRYRKLRLKTERQFREIVG